MRHGETLGYDIPAQKQSRKAELEALRAAAKDLNQMIASCVGRGRRQTDGGVQRDSPGCPREKAEVTFFVPEAAAEADEHPAGTRNRTRWTSRSTWRHICVILAEVANDAENNGPVAPAAVYF